MSRNPFQLELNTDQALIASEVPSQRVLEIAVQAPEALESVQRPVLNLALVLDRSGSMAGDKLTYVCQAAVHVLELVSPNDRVALVAYDDHVDLLSPSRPVTSENRAELKRAIYALRPGNSTDLSGGWLTGCEEVAAAATEGSINRALLLTDGLANAGITDLEELARHARELAARGITTSTFGVGQGFNEHLLEAMSNQGAGNFYYIEMPLEIPSLFEREFKELAAVTVRDVEITLDVPAKVSVQVLGGWRSETQTNPLRVFLGNLTSSRRQEVYLKLLTPPESAGGDLVFTVRAIGKGEAGDLLEAKADMTFHYTSQGEAAAAPRRVDVLERYAPVDLAEAANEALKLERKGEKDKASRLLKQSLNENRPFMPAPSAATYDRLSERMAQGMDEDDRKASHYNTYNQKRRRDS